MSTQQIRALVRNELEKLNFEARSKRPREKPLIISTNYYEKIKVFREHMLFIYYAYYGHGKTHGVALKLYHEALDGELSGFYDVIVLQLRDIVKSKESNLLDLTRQIKGVDPILALIAASLIIGVSKDKCGSLVENNCYSTITEKIEKPITFDIEEVTEGLKKQGSKYLREMIEKIINITERSLILVFDEFEELIKEGRFILTGESSYEFIYKLSTLLRREFFDKGFTRFKIVALIQKAVLSEYIIKKLLEKLSKSPEEGITVFEEIEPYPPDVYADYVIIALKRLDDKFSFGRSEVLTDEKIHLFRQELEKTLRPLSIVPPRIAFYIAQDFIANLVKEIIEYKNKSRTVSKLADIRTLIRSASINTLDSMKKLSELTRLYIILSTKGKVIDDKTTIRNDETINRMLALIAKEVLGCDEGRISNFKYSTYYGTICLESIRPELLIDITLLKLSHSSKTKIDKAGVNLARELSKSIANIIYLNMKVRNLSPVDIPKVKIRIYPIIRRNISPSLVFLIIQYAISKLKNELSNRLSKNLGINARRIKIESSIVNPYIMDEEDAIILYYKVKEMKKRKKDALFSDYIERRYEDLINYVKNIWKTGH